MKDITLEDICGPVSNGAKPFSRIKQPGELGHTTLKAKELFLFGDGDGKPVRNLARLAALSGSSARTLEKHVAAWQEESVALARGNAGKRGQVAKVTPEVIAWQCKQVALLKGQCDKLFALVESLPPGTDAHADALKLYNATIKTWAEQSGYSDYAASSAAYAKELARMAAKQTGKTSDDGRNVTPGNFNFSVAPALPDKSE